MTCMHCGGHPIDDVQRIESHGLHEVRQTMPCCEMAQDEPHDDGLSDEQLEQLAEEYGLGGCDVEVVW